VNPERVGGTWDSRRGSGHNHNFVSDAALAGCKYDLVHLLDHLVGVGCFTHLESRCSPDQRQPSTNLFIWRKGKHWHARAEP